MSQGATSPTDLRFLPFSVLSENRKQPFTPDMEMAIIYCLAELDRSKGGGIILKQPKEKLLFIAQTSYPIWVQPSSDAVFAFDGLARSDFTLSYLEIADVNAFMENLKRAARTRETHLAFLSDNLNYFQPAPREKELRVKGLIGETRFLSEFDSYRREASKNRGENLWIGLLQPTIDNIETQTGIRELESLKQSLQSNTEDLCKCMKSLNTITRQYVKELQSGTTDIAEEFNDKIKEEEALVTPQIGKLKDEYDYRTNSLTKTYEKARLPLQRQKTMLEKSRADGLAKIQQCKSEAMTHERKGQRAAERKWREKSDKLRKEVTEIENQLKHNAKALEDLEDKRSAEVFNLREELEMKVKDARKNLVELEASRDAKILIQNQEIEKLEKQTNEISGQISRTAKLMDANIAQFTRMGIKKELGLERSVLYYVPFYVVCYGADSKKLYTIIPPSTASSIGVFTKLKGALGMAKIRKLLVPRFKAISSFLTFIDTLMRQNPILETEINELGAENNILTSGELPEDVKLGLQRLKSEGWLSEKELAKLNLS